MHENTILGTVNGYAGYWLGQGSSFVALFEESSPVTALENGMLVFNTSMGCTVFTEEAIFELSTITGVDPANQNCNSLVLYENKLYASFGGTGLIVTFDIQSSNPGCKNCPIFNLPDFTAPAMPRPPGAVGLGVP